MQQILIWILFVTWFWSCGGLVSALDNDGCLWVFGIGGGRGVTRFAFTVSCLWFIRTAKESMHWIESHARTHHKETKVKKKEKKLNSNCVYYPRSPSSFVALYWMGISMRAARAKAASFSAGFAFFAMIAVKLTNCMVIQSLKTIVVS